MIEEAKRATKHRPVEGFLKGQGSLHSKLMLIGEAPGRTEIETGQPFTGQSGRELDRWLKEIELKREDIYITSVFRSRPYNKKGNNRPPTKAEVYAHSQLLDVEIEHLNPPLIVLMGNTALHRLLDSRLKISEFRGQLIESHVKVKDSERPLNYKKSEKIYQIFPTYHPSAVLYRRSLEDTIKADYLEIGRLVDRQLI